MANPPKKKIPSKKKKSQNPPIQNNGDSQESLEGMRLNKFIAHCGICSRRKAAEYIQEGLVAVNGNTVNEIGHRVMEGDVVTFKDKPVYPVTKKIYLLLNKPKDVVTTVNDEKGRKTVMDIIRKSVSERIYPVGRLDRATLGLLLLTNDGELAEKLSHPSHGVSKVYHVVLDKPLSTEHLEMIRKGLILEDGFTPVDGINYIQNAAPNHIGIEIHIGKNRVVRRIFEHFGYQVEKLDRTMYAGLTKKDLPRGHFRHLSEKEIIMLKHFT